MGARTPRRDPAAKGGRPSARVARLLWAVAAITLLGVSVLAGLAAADPVQDAQQTAQGTQQGAEQTAQDPGASQNGTGDTKYTPVPGSIHDAAVAGWRQVGGAIFPAAGNKEAAQGEMGYVDDGSIPYTVDFFTVSFRGSDDGLAAGAACQDPKTPDTDEALANCVRVPVIYRYAKPDPTQPPRWSEAYRGDGTGFIGAIAWIPGADKAVAVGGNGCYPRREVDCTTGNPPTGDTFAGDGRAWILESGQWHPVSPLPPGMTGMTALDFSTRTQDCGAVSACGLAGGKGQIWMWKDGHFVPSYQFQPTDDPSSQSTSPFRVRKIAFTTGNTGTLQALAVTSGCCGAGPTQGVVDDPTVNFPRVMMLVKAKWQIHALLRDTGTSRTDTLPDSLYSVIPSGGLAGRFSVIAAQGGPEQPVEPGSRVIGPFDQFAAGSLSDAIIDTGNNDNTSPVGPNELVTPQLSSVHLVAGDGDLEGHGGGPQQHVMSPQAPGPDGRVDWAVGELRSTGRAVAYTTVTQPTAPNTPYPLACPGGGGASSVSAQCQADTTTPDQVKSRYLFYLPSYPLNAFTMDPTSGVGWAAGDRGALLTFGGGSDAASAGGIKPFKAGGAQPSRLSNRDAYDAFHPLLSAEPGLVPPLAAQPVTELSTGRLVPAGSPDPNPADSVRPQSVQAIAMSSDGSEGWAVGPNSAGGGPQTFGTTTLYHFNGVRWTGCDPSGVPGALKPDTACAGLSSLSSAARSQGGARIMTVARVPLENGDDQSKADDFEAVALAVDPSNGGVEFLRYRGGSWDIDGDWSRQIQSVRQDQPNAYEAAFGAPDDGWLLVKGQKQQLWHLTSTGWTACDSGNYSTTCLDKGDAKGPVVPTNPATTTPAGGDAAAIGGFVSGLHFTAVGKRVYLYGTRLATVNNPAGGAFPVIVYEDPATGQWTRAFDPKNGVGGGQSDQGTLNSISLARGDDGKVTAWGIGDFTPSTCASSLPGLPVAATNQGHTPLIRGDADSDGKQWTLVCNPDPAAAEYLLPETLNENISKRLATEQVISLPGPGGQGAAVAAPVTGTGNSPKTMVWFNPSSGHWEVFPSPSPAPFADAMAADGRGGFWLAVHPGTTPGTWFEHYTTRVNSPVFTDVPHPIRQPITATAAGGDGSFWVATASGTVYRYDRLTGWDQVALKGWDAGGAVQSPAYAIAVGPDGSGLVVGKSGRIADVGPHGAVLDPAAALCSSHPERCGGGRTLRAAAVAPDGSALVGGDSRALLWRPAGGELTKVTPPGVSVNAAITAISMPTPERAWLTTDGGDVFAGTRGGADWQWVREGLDAGGHSLTRGSSLRSIAIDQAGHGYAVGDGGVIIERTGDGSEPWRRLAAGYGEGLRSVALGPGGKGALIGGEAGLVLTLVNGRFEVARASDFFDPVVQPGERAPGGVVGVALLPGSKAGDVEAWAAEQLSPGSPNRSPAPGAILHYTNETTDPMLAAGAGRVQPIPDAPKHQDGELDIAAFGKSDCQLATGGEVCPEFTGSDLANEVIARRIRDTLLTGDHRPDLAVFTGDVNDAAGSSNHNVADTPADSSRIHERWSELIATPFARAGVPLYGALGGQDLSNTQACDPAFRSRCVMTHQTRTGLNLAWRQAFAHADAPWGSQTESSSDGVTFEQVGSGSGAADTSALPTGGARTHYAVDMIRGGKKVLRLAVVDTSLKTLAGVAGVQNPVEDQLTWLDNVLQEGRDAGEPAVVVSETPSYTYGSAGTTDTLTDSAAFEALLVKNRVSAVVSGRLGWNGLYWIEAPGLHSPCPGQPYQQQAPTDPTNTCQGGDAALSNADKVAQALQGLGAQVPPPSRTVQELTGSLLTPIPVAVAASAGGKFGPDGSAGGSAADGFWHGYSLVRLFSNGSSFVEQRPVFDWVGIQANDHSMTPGQRPMKLNGYGREPVGSDQPIRYDDIDGPAITHRYDLVLADPEKPYMPKVDPTSSNPHGYVAVPADIAASIDEQSGAVSYGGRGNHPPVYAVAILSVGDKAATWPIVFQPKRSFRQEAPPAQRVVLPPPPRVEAAVPASLPGTPGAQVPNPPPLNLTFPAPPSLPNMTLNAPQARPPAPPAPPPPPASPAATALQISTAPVGLTVAPPASVIPPPAPPIQPAPPGGARREARQRQAAVAKSEEGAGQEGAQEAESNGGNGGGSQSASTRLSQRRDDYAFTALEHRSQPSAWPRDLLYGGGLGLAALTLALGWGLARPRSRRREPDLPAPAWAPSRSERR
jgi:hypothetical protein